MKFNEKLIELRRSKGLSQEELGFKLNVTRQTISKWELGQTTPEMSKLTEIANIFNISVDDLLNEDTLQKTEINNINTESEEEKFEYQLEGNGRNNKNAIIVGFLCILIIGLLIGIFYYAVEAINKKKSEEQVQNSVQQFLDNTGEMINSITKQQTLDNTINSSDQQQINDNVGNIIDSATDILQDGINDFNNQKEKIKEENEKIDKQYNEISEQINNMIKEQKTNNKKDVEAFNRLYESLYSGRQAKLFVETAINKVIQNNMKKQRIISVKYNNTLANTPEELSKLVSKLNKDYYLVLYDYDEDGYISQMNINNI